MSTYVPPNSRKVECSRCGQHMCKKQIDFHLKVYGNGNGAYLTHKATSTTLKVFELHYNGKAIKTKSLFAMFGHKTNQKKDEKKSISVPNYKHKPGGNRLPPIRPAPIRPDQFIIHSFLHLSEQKKKKVEIVTVSRCSFPEMKTLQTFKY
eukprot:479470_1